VAGVTITLAPATAAPEGSATWPRRDPEPVWANNALTDNKDKNAMIQKCECFSTFINLPVFF
jgi:hypothetical protein